MLAMAEGYVISGRVYELVLRALALARAPSFNLVGSSGMTADIGSQKTQLDKLRPRNM